MKNRWWMTVAAVLAAALVQAQGKGGMGAGMGGAWMKYQDKLSPVKDYTVTMIMDVNGQEMASKMSKLGQKVRMEMTVPGVGMQTITLMDPDAEGGKGVAYTLMPAMKTAMKIPLSADAAPVKAADGKEPDIKTEELGKEQVDGVSCDKRRVTVTVDGKAQVMTLWTSPAAKNMPVKISMAEPAAATVKFKDYDFKKPSEDLFKLPADYKVSDMSQMMMNMPGAR